MKELIKIHEKDIVLVALKDIKKGTKAFYEGGSVTVLSDIKKGHKVALRDINPGELIIKYGEPIGVSTEFIKMGSHVHIHNIKTLLSDKVSYEYKPVEKGSEAFDDNIRTTFKGYVRKNGKVGVRNEIWIIPTVGCVNDVVKAIERNCKEKIMGSVDGVFSFPHPYGCSQMGDDQENTRNILADLISHPNAGGVLVVGLGCENSNIDVLKPYLGNYDENRIRFLVSQEVEDEILEGSRIVSELIDLASQDTRTVVPVSKLTVGLKCGGSDGLSGITANPITGLFSDMLVKNQGTTILTEVPEMFGAEKLLMERCENQEVFDKTVALINDFKDYFSKNGQTIYENPSPGNKAGGISTLEDKSLGCTQKSGSAKISDVLKYSERVKCNGLNLLSAPGNDLVAATALSAAGANIVIFTTGRGTPFSAPVPTIKVSSNSELNNKKKNWIDFDAGTLILGKKKAELSKELYDFVLDVAEGKKVSSEKAGFHDFAIFKQGVTL